MVQQRDGVGLVKVVVPDDHCTQATYRRAVGRRLRTARIVLDISQQEIADAAGCSRNFVSGIERGRAGRRRVPAQPRGDGAADEPANPDGGRRLGQLDERNAARLRRVRGRALRSILGGVREGDDAARVLASERVPCSSGSRNCDASWSS